MSLYMPNFNMSQEPNQGNIAQWMDGIYTRFQPFEQNRWNQSNIDTLFYAGCQNFVNQYFNFAPKSGYQQYYFNLIQQPINMISGYQRQHRKSVNYTPTEGADPNTTDQYTRIITHTSNTNGIHEAFSKACELSAISGMVLMQPYLDFTGDDHAQGELKVKVWEYNSFLVDPFFRSPDMSDCQFVWCQEYISRNEAASRFPEQSSNIGESLGGPQRKGKFYFLPEAYSSNNSDLLVLSYVWYKWKRKKKRLYSQSRNQFFDFAGGDAQLEQILYNIPDMEEVTVEVPCWKLAVILNERLVYQGENPLGFDGCPFTPVFWNYEPHINYPDLRVRSLIRTMRDPQFLFNYKVITNNDITAATINAGWKRKIGAVANEDNLKKTGQGWDVIINEGYELGDVEKIIPSGVPESDMALAEQMADLIFKTSGIQLENWAGQEDKQISSLTALIKQAANLMVFQKYFDQWDQSLKCLGELMLKIVLNNWNEAKVSLLLGEEPSPHFYSRIFAKYQVIVEEGLLTPTQKNFQAHQLMEINERFGREVFPPSMIIKDMNLQGKAEAMEFLQNQEKAQQQQAQMQEDMAHSFEDARLKELYSRATSNIAMARERNGRTESNLGLFEERLSMITKNQAESTKTKIESLEKLVDVISKYGELETADKMRDLEILDYGQEQKEDVHKDDARRATIANDFQTKIMGSISSQQLGNATQMEQPAPQQQQRPMPMQNQL